LNVLKLARLVALGVEFFPGFAPMRRTWHGLTSCIWEGARSMPFRSGASKDADYGMTKADDVVREAVT
jgi:hypothetical protein